MVRKNRFAELNGGTYSTLENGITVLDIKGEREIDEDDVAELIEKSAKFKNNTRLLLINIPPDTGITFNAMKRAATSEARSAVAVVTCSDMSASLANLTVEIIRSFAAKYEISAFTSASEAEEWLLQHRDTFG